MDPSVRFPLALAALCLLPPTGLAGTEERPEVSAPPGGVEYYPLYVGTRDHEYLDLRAAWLTYDATEDLYVIHIKIATSDGLTPPAESVRYGLRGDFWNGTALAGILEATVSLNSALARAEGFPNETVRIALLPAMAGPHREITGILAFRTGSPAYFDLAFARRALLALGDRMDRFNASAAETAGPGAPGARLVSNDTTNHKHATSNVSYSFHEAVPWRLRDAGAVPHGPDPGEGTKPSDARESPSVSSAAWTLLVIASLAVRSRRYTRQ